MRVRQTPTAKSLTSFQQGPSERLIVSSDWALYGGPMGPVTPRAMGCTTVYFAANNPFRIRHDGSWHEMDLAIVPPFVEHEIVAYEAGQITMGLMLEVDAFQPVSINRATLELLRLPLREVIASGAIAGAASASDTQDRVALVLEQYLDRRVLDARVAAAVEQIRRRPWDNIPASTLADASCLSFSRFLHLFKEETGLTFRRFVAWKRARYVLEEVRNAASLTAIAFDAGYPDSTHFSHSIRRAYGLQAKQLFSRCANMPVHVMQQAEPTG